MKLPSYKRIYDTDYKEEFRPLVSTLAVSINNAFDTLYNALNGNLTLKDNIASTIASFSVTVDSTGRPLQPTQFKLATTQTTVEGLIVINAYGANNSAITPSSAVFVSFTKNENFIIVNKIAGLTANIPYTIKVVVIG
jgi:hypothetical protein